MNSLHLRRLSSGELTSWFRRSKPGPDSAANIIVEEADPHHLRFPQPRALGLKVSDEFTVPRSRDHYQQLHQAGNEVAWWHDLDMKALAVAQKLWEQTHTREGHIDQQTQSINADDNKTTANS